MHKVWNLNCCFVHHLRYDPKMNRWTNVSSMNTRRLGVAVSVLNNHLYVVGGSDGTTPLNSVER